MKIILAIWAIVFLASAGALARQGEPLPLIGTVRTGAPCAGTHENDALKAEIADLQARLEAIEVSR